MRLQVNIQETEQLGRTDLYYIDPDVLEQSIMQVFTSVLSADTMSAPLRNAVRMFSAMAIPIMREQLRKAGQEIPKPTGYNTHDTGVLLAKIARLQLEHNWTIQAETRNAEQWITAVHPY